MSAPNLHRYDPTERFSDRADAYVRARPSYPPAVIDAVLDGLADPCGLVVADVGAGTGISARLIAERGAAVHAIEPNEQMRDAAVLQERVVWRDGTAERTGLETSAVDLVVCAQAFHWFRPDEAIEEFCRILRPGGRIALIWNDRDDDDALTRRYSEIIRIAAEGHPTIERAGSHEPFMASTRLRDQRSLGFVNEQRLDRAGLRARATSSSYVPSEGALREAMLESLDELVGAHGDADGCVCLRYRTAVYVAETAS